VGGGIAVAKGVVGDEIETGFHGVAEFLVQGGLVSHGSQQTQHLSRSQDRKQETGWRLAPRIRFPPYP
jgi:hypothetical protein